MTKPIPDGFHTITPHIIVQDATKALEFYKKAFGAEEKARHMTPDGKVVMHAQLKIGDSMLMLANEFPPMCLSPKSRGGSSVTIHLYVENADAAFDRALKAGCTIKMGLGDQFWGDRYGAVEDPFGHQWSIATHKHDYTPEQLEANTKAAFAKMGECK
jgi:PhnB protein